MHQWLAALTISAHPSAQLVSHDVYTILAMAILINL